MHGEAWRLEDGISDEYTSSVGYYYYLSFIRSFFTLLYCYYILLHTFYFLRPYFYLFHLFIYDTFLVVVPPYPIISLGILGTVSWLYYTAISLVWYNTLFSFFLLSLLFHRSTSALAKNAIFHSPVGDGSDDMWSIGNNTTLQV